MTIYSNKNYRKIYTEHFGPIPFDSTGRVYDIHHKDGNRSNNDPSNLIAVSIQEHYDIHYSRGDYGACYYTAGRMNLSASTLSELATKSNQRRVYNGTHNFLGGSIQKEMVNSGTHHFLGGKIQSESNQKRLKLGTHHLLGPANNQKKVLAGTHNFLGDKNPSHKRIAEGTHPFVKEWICQYCLKRGKGIGLFTRWHGENCASQRSKFS
jgi:HNH endonuclease